MKPIHVKRYDNPKSIGWAGYIEPDDKSWIAFVDLDGRPKVYLHRDETGRCLPDDPADRGPGASVDGGALPPLIRPDGSRLDG